MTIGIAVAGAGAGRAAFAALRAVERVGRGAIGGFVSFAAITEDGRLLRAQTQRGGTLTLFTDGERTGVAPPAAIAAAPLAVLMSSGPDRPTPLSQFTPGDPHTGLVTGHRLPNLKGACGGPLNAQVLARLSRGASPEEAVALLRDNPGADAGVIAVSRTGTMALANTDRVARRDDLGSLLLRDNGAGITVGVLHNAIFPPSALAALAASAAADAIDPADRVDAELLVRAGLPLEPGPSAAVEVEGDEVVKLTVVGDAWLGERWDGAALMRGAPVLSGGTLLGTIVSEPYCVAEHGHLVSLSGGTSARVGMRRARAIATDRAFAGAQDARSARGD